MEQSFVLYPSDSIKQGQFNPFSAGKLKDATIEWLKEISFYGSKDDIGEEGL